MRLYFIGRKALKHIPLVHPEELLTPKEALFVRQEFVSFFRLFLLSGKLLSFFIFFPGDSICFFRLCLFSQPSCLDRILISLFNMRQG